MSLATVALVIALSRAYPPTVMPLAEARPVITVPAMRVMPVCVERPPKPVYGDDVRHPRLCTRAILAACHAESDCARHV